MDKPVFKSAVIGGFERQSVLNYIQEIANNTQEAQDRLKAQIEEVSAARGKLEQSLKELENRLSDSEKNRGLLGADLHNAKTKNNELSSMSEMLNKEVDRQKAIIREKDEQLRLKDKAMVDLEWESSKLQQQNTELQKERDEIEKTRYSLGELMINARLESENIIEQAKNKAQEIIDQAVNEAAQTVEQAMVKSQRIEEAANRSSQKVSEQVVIFRREMGLLEEKMEIAMSSMKEKFTEINEAVSKSECNVISVSRTGCDESAEQQAEEFF